MPPDLSTYNPGPALSATSDTPAPAPAADPSPPADPPAPAPEPDAPAVPEPDAPEPDAPEPEPSPAEPPQLRKARETAQDRIRAITAERRADARADQLAKSLEIAIEALNKAQTPAAPAAPAEPAPEDIRPSRADFVDPDTYDAALVEWSARTSARITAAQIEKNAAERKVEDDRRAEQERGVQNAERIRNEWGEKKNKLVAETPEYADYDDVVFSEAAFQVPMSPAMAPTIMEGDPRLLYHLIKNPTESARIAALPDRQAVFELGKLAASLDQTTRPPARTPAPRIAPVAGSRSAANGSGEPTMEEYAASRMPKLQGERTSAMWGRPRVN